MSTFSTCTSTTRPSSPTDGDVLFETDTKNVIVWDGSNWYIYDYDDTTAFQNSLSLSFDGGDKLYTDLQCPSTTEFSVSLWCKSTNTTSSIAFVDDGPTGGGQGSFQIISPSTTKAFYILFKNASTANVKVSVGGTNSTLDLRDGLWHHLAVTINGTSLKIYKDGGDAAINASNTSNNQGTPFVSETTTTANGWSSNVGMAGNTGTTYVIGSQGYSSSSYYWNGGLDEISFFTTELTGSQVSDIYNSGSPNDIRSAPLSLSPLAYFRMGDGPSDVDSTGNAASAGQSAGTVFSLENGYRAYNTYAGYLPTYSSDVPT